MIIHIHMHTHVHIHTYAHTNIHMCVLYVSSFQSHLQQLKDLVPICPLLRGHFPSDELLYLLEGLNYVKN